MLPWIRSGRKCVHSLLKRLPMHTTVPPAVPAAHRQATNTNILVKPLHGQKEKPTAASETVRQEKIGKSNRHRYQTHYRNQRAAKAREIVSAADAKQTQT
jgi:hypothetical protein